MRWRELKTTRCTVSYLKEFYFKVNPEYDGKSGIDPDLTLSVQELVLRWEWRIRRFTMPMLGDKKAETIVNNESSEIIRMLNSAYDDQLPADKVGLDLYPKQYQEEIDEINDWVFNTVNSETASDFPTIQDILMLTGSFLLSSQSGCIR